MNQVALIPPPSANNLWRTFRNRQVRSKAYNDWLEYAVQEMEKHLTPVTGRVKILIILHEGKGITMSSDLDNYIKPVLDALKPPTFKNGDDGKQSKPGASIIEDDDLRHVHRIVADFAPYTGPKSKRPSAYIHLVVTPYDVFDDGGQLC